MELRIIVMEIIFQMQYNNNNLSKRIKQTHEF